MGGVSLRSPLYESGRLSATNRLRPHALLQEDAKVSARLFNDAGRRRRSMFDCMIAATALRFDSALATANIEDFRRFSSAGLELFEA